LAELRKTESGSRNVYETVKSNLAAAIKSSGPTPLHEAISKVLGEFSITQQQYFGGAFIGEHCHKLLRSCGDIIDKCCVLMKSPEYRDPSQKESTLNESIDLEMEHIKDLMTIFNHIAILIRRIQPLSPLEIDDLCKFCKRFGEDYRTYFPKSPIPPKLHILESHVPDYVKSFGVLGLFSEDLIERCHHINKIFDRIYSAIKEFEKREESKQKREEGANLVEVTKIKSEVEQSSRRSTTDNNQKQVLKRKEEKVTIERENIKRVKNLENNNIS